MNTFLRRSTFALILAVSVPSIIAMADPSSKAPAAVGCTPKREAAFADISKTQTQCLESLASDITLSPEAAIAKCEISAAPEIIRDLINLFVGAQLRYKCATLDAGIACSSVVTVDAGATH